MAPAAQPIPELSPWLFNIEVFPETHPFYTCGDAVRGVVRVRPTLRPQRVSITLRGYCVIFDKNVLGAAPEFFRYKQDLFESSGAHENFDILRRGTASDGKVELPFEFTFPHIVGMPPPSGKAWRYSRDSHDHPRFQHSPGFVPPPSCTALVSPKGPLAPKIYYSLEACLESVNVDNPKVTIRHHLKFLPPAPEYDLALLQPNVHLGTSLPKHCSRYKLIRTRKLLPGYQESSKLGKVKDMLVDKELFFGLTTYSEVPFAKFNLFATPARILVIGSSIPIAITVKHLERSASLPNPPDLFLRRIRVQLLPTFSILIPRPASTAHATKEVVETARDTWTLLDQKYDEGNGEPLFDGLRLSDIQETTLAHDKLLPSFSSYGLTLEYEIQVEIWGECAKHDFSGIAHRSEVQIVTGWNAVPPLVNPVDSNASVPELDPRPEYQERDPMSARHDLGSPELRSGLNDMAPTYDYEAPPPMRMDVPLRSMPPPYMG
jgi:hypothetical protein